MGPQCVNIFAQFNILKIIKPKNNFKIIVCGDTYAFSSPGCILPIHASEFTAFRPTDCNIFTING